MDFVWQTHSIIHAKKVYFYRQNQEEIENYDQSNGLFWLRWISTHFETFFPPFFLHVQCLWVYCHFGYFNSAWQQLFEIMSAVYSICWSNVICAASPFNVIYAWSELADEKSDENVLYLWFMTKFFGIALCEAIKWAFFAISDSIVCCPFHTSPQPSTNTNHSDTRIPCDDIKLFYFTNFLSSIFVRINVLADMKHVMVWNGFPTEQNIIQIKNQFYNNSKPLNPKPRWTIFVCLFVLFPRFALVEKYVLFRFGILMNDQQPNFMLKMLSEFSKQPFEFELRKTMHEKKGSSLYLNRFAK